eukprot:CAMPEP_0194493822 /NCGR_PEP_ID=MMETSP0253-20130528/11918_1 /TAXON_ID=2966 /ORGANISM="Noctiluca scintillans" /LENGTH=750 /DNA_ID=CAMNT_0039334853 /DNA_START=118 /DNA_END=2370 /DNA_ORIENTATION=+
MPAPSLHEKSGSEAKPRYAAGTPVEYYSSGNGGWIQGKVLGFTKEGLYELDVQPNALPEKVRLPAASIPLVGGTQYAPNTLVEYFSPSCNKWIGAKVIGWDIQGFYVLDVEAKAPPVRVRLPVAAPVPSHGDAVAVVTLCGTSVPASSLHEKAGDEAKPRYAAGTPVEYYSCRNGGWIRGKVLGSTNAGLYDLDVQPNALPEKVRLPMVASLPSPDAGGTRYAANTLVEYHRSSDGRWIDAKVLGFNAHGFYMLDVEANAPPDMVRLPEAAVPSYGDAVAVRTLCRARAPVPETNNEIDTSICPYTRGTFTNMDGLLSMVEEEALAPIRGKYLLDLLEDGGCLVRRQGLPSAAFWTACALRNAAQALDQDMAPGFKGFANVFVALSYRWISADHPDPDGHHLKIVCRAIRSFLRCVDDVALFWDFASLFQNPGRTPEQDVLFKKGLLGCNVWYGHQQSTVWLQSCMPEGFCGPSYNLSGWCFVEATVSSVIKATDKRVDLGAQSSSRVPLSPQRVAHLLKHEKHFTNKSDINQVVSMYEQFFSIAASETALRFPKARWDASHIRELTEVLPKFVLAAELDLSHNDIASDGGHALARLLVVSSSVTDFNLRTNNIKDQDVVAFAGVLKKHTSLRLLNLRDNGIQSKGAMVLADVLKENRSMTHLEIRFNNIGDDGVKALAAALRVNSSLVHLNLRKCCIGDVGANALSEALMTNTTLETLDLCENSIGDVGKEALAAAARVKGTIKTIHLS